MTETEQPRVAEHVYKRVGDTPLTLRMFRQAGWRSDERRSAIVLFFGGGWTNGTPSQFEPQCRHLAALEASGLFGLNTCTIRVPMSAEPCPCRGVVGTVG